jgi:serine/threonine-protein phosphatase PP1 catalytic subunit
MGNQQSSEKGKKAEKGGADGVPLGREYYRSFERSDTKDSTRSLRNSLRNKIPGTGKSDSPRGSVAGLSDVNGKTDKSDAASTKSRGSRRNSAASASVPPESAPETPVEEVNPDEPQPPPSPVHGATLGTGHEGGQGSADWRGRPCLGCTTHRSRTAFGLGSTGRVDSAGEKPPHTEGARTSSAN